MPNTDVALRAAARLRAAVEGVADALATPRVETLLACEAALEHALADLPPMAGLSAAGAADLRAELDRARAALLRCRRLGASLTEFIRFSLEAQGIGGGYGRPRPTYSGQTLDTRI